MGDVSRAVDESPDTDDSRNRKHNDTGQSDTGQSDTGQRDTGQSDTGQSDTRESDTRQRDRDQVFAERPWRLGRSDWRAVGRRVWAERARDDVSTRASAVAFSAMFAIPALLIAVVSIYGLLASPAQVAELVQRSSTVLPDAATELLSTQLERLTSQHSGALSLGVAFGVVTALWSVSGAVNQVSESMNEVYGESDERAWYVQRAWAIVASIVMVAVFVVAVGLIALLPAVLDWLEVTGVFRATIIIGRWFVLAALMVGLLGSLYRFGPRRSAPRIPWITVGTMLAVAAWLAMSLIFGLYTTNFASYNETYGSLGTVIIFMTWLYLSAYIVLMAGELNAELEHHTSSDTTIDGDQPFGDRGAFVADTHPRRVEDQSDNPSSSGERAQAQAGARS